MSETERLARDNVTIDNDLLESVREACVAVTVRDEAEPEFEFVPELSNEVWEELSDRGDEKVSDNERWVSDAVSVMSDDDDDGEALGSDCEAECVPVKVAKFEDSSLTTPFALCGRSQMLWPSKAAPANALVPSTVPDGQPLNNVMFPDATLIRTTPLAVNGASHTLCPSNVPP